MSNMQWVKISPRGWFSDAAFLTATERGIYISLIMRMYEEGEPLNDDVGRLARICGVGKKTLVKALETFARHGLILISDEGLKKPLTRAFQATKGRR